MHGTPDSPSPAEESAPGPMAFGAEDCAGMEAALAEARRALREEEVPIGAAVLLDGKVVGLGHNRTRADIDPTGHAEILALRAACAAVGANRLVGATVYTTVEPCFMCAGALMHARVARVVWAVRDPKFGACASLAEVLRHPGLNHRVDQAEGLMADEARALLQGFFRAIRAARRDPGGVGGASAGEPNDAAERHGG